MLTTRRVLMLAAARLTPVAEAWGHPRNSRSALGASGGLSVSAVSVAWAGSSAVCTLEDGRCVGGQRRQWGLRRVSWCGCLCAMLVCGRCGPSRRMAWEGQRVRGRQGKWGYSSSQRPIFAVRALKKLER